MSSSKSASSSSKSTSKKKSTNKESSNSTKSKVNVEKISSPAKNLSNKPETVPVKSPKGRKSAKKPEIEDSDSEKPESLIPKNAMKMNGSVEDVEEAPIVIDSDSESDVAEPDSETQPTFNFTTLAGGRFSKCPVVFTRDSRFLFCAVASHIKVFSVSTAQAIKTLSSTSRQSHNDFVTTLQLNPLNHLQLFSGSLDGYIRLWDVNDGVLLKSWKIGKPVLHFRIDLLNPSKAFIAVQKKSTGNNKVYSEFDSDHDDALMFTVLHYNLDTNVAAKKSLQLEGCVGLEVSTDGRFVVALSSHTMAVFDQTASGTRWRRYNFECALTTFAIHPTEPYIALGDIKGKIHLWYGLEATKPVVSVMHWHAHRVNHLAFTKDGVYLLSGGEESVLVLWQLQSRHKEFLPRLGSEIVSISVSPDQSLFALTQNDNCIRVVSAVTMRIQQSIRGLKLSPQNRSVKPKLVVEPRNGYVAASGTPGILQFYNPKTDSHVFEVEVCPRNRVSRTEDKYITEPEIQHVSFSSDGTWMATVDFREDPEFDTEVYLKFWKYDENLQNYVLKTRVDSPHKNSIVSLRYRSNWDHAPMFVTLDSDGEVKLWRQRQHNGETVNEFWANKSTHTFRGISATDAAFSTDGSLLAVAHGQFITLWDPKSSTLQTELSYTNQTVRKVLFAPDSPHLLAITDEFIHMWSLLSCSVEWSCKLNVVHALSNPKSKEFFLVIKSSDGFESITINRSSAIPTSKRKLTQGYVDVKLVHSDPQVTKAEILFMNDKLELQSGDYEEPSKDDSMDLDKEDPNTSFFSVYAKKSTAASKQPSQASLPTLPSSSKYAFSEAPTHALPNPSKMYSVFMDQLLLHHDENNINLKREESRKKEKTQKIEVAEAKVEEYVGKISNEESEKSVIYFGGLIQGLFSDSINASIKSNGKSNKDSNAMDTDTDDEKEGSLAYGKKRTLIISNGVNGTAHQVNGSVFNGKKK
ncbi:WD repeat-containing protein 75 [Nowakowskiella sp. JEL0407]|nr:WD repeat-containing protein 75 [Nowakowskiella sp. JEL0407]